MKELTRTLIFVVVAGVSVAVAAVTHVATRPQPLDGFEKVGQEFFPAFSDPNEAKSLHVAAFDEDTATVRRFRVEWQQGGWRIPSHHNYPADAEDRLAKTAASVIGITRGALASRRESDHERYGVIDPLNEDATTLRGRGQRITLTLEDGSVLADYIIGKQAEGGDNYYYVRHPREKETYIVQMNINLSTKFSDWIESDLLKFERDDLVEIVVNRYSIDEQQFRIVGQEVNKLERESWNDPWTLEGMDDETEEVRTDDVNRIVNSLDNLRIVGVRPKPQGLNPDLSLDPQIARNPLLVNALRSDLASKGFLVASNSNGDPLLVSNEGELHAATNKGIVYTLHFGEIFTGDETEIEIGTPSAEETADGESKDAERSIDDEVAEIENADSQSGRQPRKRSRYLFVSAQFDPAYIGEKPQPPVKPEPPADRDDADDETSSEEGSPDEGEDNPDASPSDNPQQTHEEALQQYEEDLAKYESDLRIYEEQVQAGREKANELSRRFGAWYYVISAESFENLRLSREELVKPKEDSDEAASPLDSSFDPENELPELPGLLEASPEPSASSEDGSNTDTNEADANETENSTESPQSDNEQSDEESEEPRTEQSEDETPPTGNREPDEQEADGASSQNLSEENASVQ